MAPLFLMAYGSNPWVWFANHTCRSSANRGSFCWQSVPRDAITDSNRQSEFRQNISKSEYRNQCIERKLVFLRDILIQGSVKYSLMLENNASHMLVHFILIKCRSFHTFLRVTIVKISFISTSTDCNDVLSKRKHFVWVDFTIPLWWAGRWGSLCQHRKNANPQNILDVGSNSLKCFKNKVGVKERIIKGIRTDSKIIYHHLIVLVTFPINL